MNKNVELIKYSRKVDFWNCLTHAAGAFFSLFALVLMLLKAEGFRDFVSATIYGVSLIAVYSVSALYHGLRNDEAKRKARLADHSTVPVLIAGTATPCALITLYDVSIPHSILVFSLAWLCTLFGIFSKIFFFEKLKNVTLVVYIVSCAVMLISVVPLIDSFDGGAFSKLVFGCIFYLVGLIFCGLGKKKEVLHTVFHIFVLIGSTFHFFVIYKFVI